MASTWAVNLAFQFDTIGTLQCRIALAGEHVSATFWCERSATHERMEKRLPVLRQAFEAQGLQVIRLAGVLGAPPEPLIKVPIPICFWTSVHEMKRGNRNRQGHSDIAVALRYDGNNAPSGHGERGTPAR